MAALVAAIAALPVTSCARRAAPAAEIVEPIVVAGEESEVGPRASEIAESVPYEAATAVGGEDGDGGAAGVWRADGRPAWWFEGVHREGDRVVVAAEAMARDVVSARRGAVEQGRAALRRATGSGVDVRVESTLVKRLAGDGPGRDRFVGYVRVSWRPSDGG